MNCRDVLDTLEAVEVGALPATEAAARDAEQHLGGCAACRTAWPKRQQWSHRLTDAMQDVSVPVGLRERLQSASAAPVRAAGRPTTRRRRVWWLVSTAAVALMAIGVGWWVMQPLPQLTDQELLAAMQAELAPLPKFSGGFKLQLPESWKRYYLLNPQLVRGFPGADQPAAGTVALIPFQFQSGDRNQSVRGRLLILRRSQFVGTLPATGFGAATIYYTKTAGAYMVWAEGDLLFVCLVPSGAADLQRFQESLSHSRPLT
ncbi:MAG TPA: hypothetical protein VM165_26070 [Planctomycetaceae bacterium]|nr:hypothetical protein [Planctomycetaceae bacterium]